ncbi:hypothetical protein [Oscillibacter sp.]|uniref:hypothetical protein n=1 Tax=Oscillibacter sp. TaxID=1945593 RepID=UPI002616E61F|nr:hypothetical protein [Oscillibacter sp.]MDD3347447.1 hypothetical protein [Oscillibacter sp.]
MKKQYLLPLSAVAGGIVALFLRAAQNRTGFETETGLPIPGSLPGIALPVLLAALALLFFLLSRRLPSEGAPGPALPADFSTRDARLLALPVAGSFLIALSGTLDLLSGFGLLGGISAASADTLTTGFSPRSHLLMGLFSLAAAAGLFLSAAACRRQGRRENAPVLAGTWLLVPVAALVVRLVLTYRACSVNPSLEAYYVELLALVFLTLSFYRLSSFAFQAGQTRRFALYVCAAVVLCIAAVADTAKQPGSLLAYLGSGATLLGFLLLRLSAPPSFEKDVE